MTKTTPISLTIAGSDSGGGAGIQADIKAMSANGVYAASVITAVTAQNTRSVSAVHEIPAPIVAAQIDAVLSDLSVQSIKLGMLFSPQIIQAVAAALCAFRGAVVVDPVMVAKGGAALLEVDAVATLKRRIVPLATVLTPNLPEAEVLCGLTIANTSDMEKAGYALLEFGAQTALVKGGHLSDKMVHDILVTADGVEAFVAPRTNTRHTHGTGCTLASAIATGIAQGMVPRDAVARAQAYVHEAILRAPGLGRGHGPIGHAHTVRAFHVD